jgi:hypothetical protein
MRNTREVSKGYIRPSTRKYYFPRLVPASFGLWTAGFGATPLLVWAFVTEPVVMPGCLLDLVASGAALRSLDAPGAGCTCADEIAVVPNHAATVRAEITSLYRMGISSF